MKKKGVVESTQLILVILLVLGFVIVTWFLLKYPFGETIDKETCHQTIVMRSSVNNWLIKMQKIIPLKCQTEKICLSISGEACEKEFMKPSKKNTISRRTVPNTKDWSTIDRIKDEYAKSLYDCHSMVGKGELSFMPNSFYEYNYCLICSRIAAGRDLKNKKLLDKPGSVSENVESIQISYLELYEYMKEMQTPDGGNYLKATYDVETVDEMRQILEKIREVNNENSENKIESIYDMKINLSGENDIIVMTIPKSTWRTWLKAGGIGVAVAGVILVPFSAGGSLGLTAVGLAAAGGGGTAAVIYIKNAPDNSGYAYPAIFSHNLENLRKLKCTSFETAP